jgi:hypothetical protein
MATRSSEISAPQIASKAEYNIVAAGDRVHDEDQFFARPIGESGFKDEAFTLSDEFLSKSPSLVIVRLTRNAKSAGRAGQSAVLSHVRLTVPQQGDTLTPMETPLTR